MLDLEKIILEIKQRADEIIKLRKLHGLKSLVEPDCEYISIVHDNWENNIGDIVLVNSFNGFPDEEFVIPKKYFNDNGLELYLSEIIIPEKERKEKEEIKEAQRIKNMEYQKYIMLKNKFEHSNIK